MKTRKWWIGVAASGAFVLLVSLSGCSTFQQIAALRKVDFAIDRVGQTNLNGISLQDIGSLEDVSPIQLLSLSRAVRDRSLPLEFVLHVEARNPESNGVVARLVGLDWTLFIEDRETVSGSLNQEISLPPGTPVDVPIGVSLDLYRFFESNVQDLVEMALGIAGKGGSPKTIRLSATPTVDTPVGPIRYPGSIDILERRIGGE